MTAGEASALLADHARATSAARIEADQLKTCLRAAMRTLIDQNREIDRLREQLQRERQQHQDLREKMLLKQEAA